MTKWEYLYTNKFMRGASMTVNSAMKNMLLRRKWVRGRHSQGAPLYSADISPPYPFSIISTRRELHENGKHISGVLGQNGTDKMVPIESSIIQAIQLLLTI